jgi:hypothetical protein
MSILLAFFHICYIISHILVSLGNSVALVRLVTTPFVIGKFTSTDVLQ